MAKLNALEEAVAGHLRARGIDVIPQDPATKTGIDFLAVVPTEKGPVRVGVQAKSYASPPRQIDHDVPRSLTMHAEAYLSPRRAQLLQSQDTAYVDSVGNMWLSLPGFYVEVGGRAAPPGRTDRSTEIDRLSRPSSLRVTFALLTQPALLQLPLRELAKTCETSVGAAQATIADLTKGGFLHGATKNRRLIKTRTLSERWVSQFTARLLPKLDHLTLSGPAPSWWLTRAENLPGNAVLGGETACELLGYPLRSVETLVYASPPWGGVRKLGRLGDEGDATVTLRERFWPIDPEDRRHQAPSLLVYADLVASDDPRLGQLATQMREQDDGLRRLWAG